MADRYLSQTENKMAIIQDKFNINIELIIIIDSIRNQVTTPRLLLHHDCLKNTVELKNSTF